MPQLLRSTTRPGAKALRLLSLRIAKTEVVGLLHLDGSSTAKVEAFTENVSPRGARVITDSVCAPGKLVRLDASEGQVNLPGRVVYCQPLARVSELGWKTRQV